MNPQHARWHFKFRMLVNAAIIICVFIPVAFVAAQFNEGWIVTITAIAVAYFVFFHVLVNRAIGLTCPGCRKYIATNTPWICGFCQAKNQRIDDFPFVHRCEHCGAEPKAYKCHHRGCPQLIFLTEDHLEQNYAYCLNAPVAPAPDERKEEISSQEREKRKLEHQLLMTRLTAELNEAKKLVDPPKEKQPREIIKESFSRHNAHTMTAYEIADRQKAANAKKYKNNPEMLERANLSVDTWLRERV